jgi:hypothetical protein
LTRRSWRWEILPVLGLIALAILAAARWTSPVQWKPDSLFYQAHVYQVRGDSHAVAYRKVFDGPLGAPRRDGEAGLPLAQRRVGNPAWVHYSERFYERRWFVPAVAALLSPFYGTDALRVVSLIAYVLLGPALYALVRLRAGRPIAFVVAAGGLLLAPVLFLAGLPLMDVTGITLEAIAAAGVFLALEHGRRWLALWLIALAALSLTRDSTVILGVAALWLALRERSRATVVLVALGAAAALPAPLLLGAPLREAMAYTFENFYRPGDSSWGWVLGHYWPSFHTLVRRNITYLHDHPLTGLYIVGGYLALFLVRAKGDRFVRFFRAAAVGSILLDALQPNYTAFRLELTFVPIAAAGLAVALQRVAANLDTGLVRWPAWKRSPLPRRANGRAGRRACSATSSDSASSPRPARLRATGSTASGS